jgi:hypothetical protein
VGVAYPRWLGLVAMVSGIAWIVHGLMVPYIGLFDSPSRGVAIILLSVWACFMAYLMWRNDSRRRIRRPRSATPHASPR